MKKYRIIKEKFRFCGIAVGGEKFIVQRFIQFHKSRQPVWHKISINNRDSFLSFEAAEKALMLHVNPPKEEDDVVKEYEF
jgi:hypothetical protein